MFDLFIVYPAALILGFLVAVALPRRGRRGTLIVLIISGFPGAILAVIGSLAYLDMVGVVGLLLGMALPAGAFSFVFGLIGGLIGIGVRALVGGIVQTWHDPT